MTMKKILSRKLYLGQPRNISLLVLVLYISIKGVFSADEDCPWALDLRVGSEIKSKCQCAKNPSSKNMLSIQCHEIDATQLVTTLTSKKSRLEPLELIYLNGSRVTDSNGQIPSRLFRDIKMSSLQLSSCGIRTLSPDAFRGQESSLKHLSLTNNEITQVPLSTISKLAQLTLLDLSYNKITRIENHSFENLSKLSTLKLNDNNLEIGERAFSGLENSLKNLNLKGTRLSSIPSSIQNLSSLAFLDLAQNRLRDLEGSPFESLHSLTALNLERNLLQTLPSKIFRGVNDSLSSLSLLNNLITHFPHSALKYLHELRVLDLGFNLLTDIPPHSFIGLSSLTLLAVDGNPLPTLPLSSFSHLNRTLRGLSLGGKFLACDCRLRWVREWVEELDLQVTSRERNPQFCASPTQLSGFTFYQLRTEDFKCEKNESFILTSTSKSISSSEEKMNKKLDTSTAKSAVLFKEMNKGGIFESTLGAESEEDEEFYDDETKSDGPIDKYSSTTPTSTTKNNNTNTSLSSIFREKIKNLSKELLDNNTKRPHNKPVNQSNSSQLNESFEDSIEILTAPTKRPFFKRVSSFSPPPKITNSNLNSNTPPQNNLVNLPKLANVSINGSDRDSPRRKIRPGAVNAQPSLRNNDSNQNVNKNSKVITSTTSSSSSSIVSTSAAQTPKKVIETTNTKSNEPKIEENNKSLESSFEDEGIIKNRVKINNRYPADDDLVAVSSTDDAKIPIVAGIGSSLVKTGSNLGNILQVKTSPTISSPHISESKNNKNNYNNRPPNLVFAERGEIELVKVERSGESVVVYWDSFKSSTGFRVVYRVFGEESYRHGPPLAPTEREYKILRIPTNECIVVCVVPSEEILYSESSFVPPGSQCRELKPDPPSVLMNNMDKITIGATAAICSTVLIALLIFYFLTRRVKSTSNSPIIPKMSPGSYPIPSTPSPGPNPGPTKEWDQLSGLSSQSIPRPKIYNMSHSSTLDQLHSSKSHSHNHKHKHNHSHHKSQLGSRSYLSPHHSHHSHSAHSIGNNFHNSSNYANNTTNYANNTNYGGSNNANYSNSKFGSSSQIGPNYLRNQNRLLRASGGEGNKYKNKRGGWERADEWTDTEQDVYMGRNATRHDLVQL